MNIKNIEGIMESKFWKKIEKNKGYRGYKIIDTYNKPQHQRISGQMFVLLVFFSDKVKDLTLKKYLKEGSFVPKKEGYEGLDNTQPYNFYGTMRMIIFS